MYFDIDSVQVLPGPPDAAKDWVIFGVLFIDFMMLSMSIVDLMIWLISVLIDLMIWYL